VSCLLPTALGPVLSLAILLGAGPALGEPITGTPDNDTLPGTPQRDTIHGLAGNDDITGAKASDRVFGDEGNDTFHWAEGDGRDRVDGGPNDEFQQDILEITATGKLRLHIDALGAGPLVTAKEELEALAVTGLEGIRIVRTGGAGQLIIASDKGILPPDLPDRKPCERCIEEDDLQIDGWERVDVRKVQASTFILHFDPEGVRHIVRGSEKFFDSIGFGSWSGDDEVRTGDGGSSVRVCGGSNVVHLGWGTDLVDMERSDCHNTVFGFGADDLVGFVNREGRLPTIDTNRDGWLDAKDGSVKVRNGSMTITFPKPSFGSPSSVTLLGIKRLRFDRVVDTCQDESCLS
jgi:Ca2+-binding RTX toxin-like protein